MQTFVYPKRAWHVPVYVAVLAQLLDGDGQALVGVHGQVYLPPHESYVGIACRLIP